jgi:hypothetical protein
VDPVPDPLLFFSGSAGNRTRASGSIAKVTIIIIIIIIIKYISKKWDGRALNVIHPALSENY